jgi:hypothetical protein
MFYTKGVLLVNKFNLILPYCYVVINTQFTFYQPCFPISGTKTQAVEMEVFIPFGVFVTLCNV